MPDKIHYKVHCFVCTNDRHGERKSCADGDPEAVRSLLKQKLKEKGWWGKQARVSSSGCLGLCNGGPNVVLYPDGTVFGAVSVDDVDKILGAMSSMVESC